MPVVSFSISESLRKFLRTLVKGGRYKNNSYVMRTALSRMMDSYAENEAVSFSSFGEDTAIKDFQKNITGNVMILHEKQDENVEKKLAKLEVTYSDSIKAKNCFFFSDKKTLIYIFESNIEKFHLFITDLNQIEDLKNIRYIIL